MTSENIDTIIDRLVEYVDLNGRVNLKDAARAMGVSADQVERVALLLEESGLVFVRYSFTGVELVSSKAPKDKEKKGKKGSGGRGEDAKRLEREVTAAEGILSFMEKDIGRRIDSAEKRLKQLEQKEDLTPDEVDAVKHELSLVLQQAAMFEEEVGKLHSKEGELRTKVLEFQKRLSATEAKRAPRKPGLLRRILEAFRKLIATVRSAFVRRRATSKLPVTGKTAADLIAEKERIALKAVEGGGQERGEARPEREIALVLKPPKKEAKPAKTARQARPAPAAARKAKGVFTAEERLEALKSFAKTAPKPKAKAVKKKPVKKVRKR